MLCYKNQGIHWYPCHPTFLWTINFRLEWRLISAFIWDISGLGNPSDGRDFREIRIDMSRFLTPYNFWTVVSCFYRSSVDSRFLLLTNKLDNFRDFFMYETNFGSLKFPKWVSSKNLIHFCNPVLSVPILSSKIP